MIVHYMIGGWLFQRKGQRRTATSLAIRRLLRQPNHSPRPNICQHDTKIHVYGMNTYPNYWVEKSRKVNKKKKQWSKAAIESKLSKIMGITEVPITLSISC